MVVTIPRQATIGFVSPVILRVACRCNQAFEIVLMGNGYAHSDERHEPSLAQCPHCQRVYRYVAHTELEEQ